MTERRSRPPARVFVPRTPPRRAQLGLVAVLFALAAAGWWWTVGEMRGMDDGPWTGLGTFGWFLGVWVVMMAAMMFPSVAPTVALYARMSRTRGCCRRRSPPATSPRGPAPESSPS